MSRHKPLPLVQSFLACSDIFEDTRSRKFILVAPFSKVTCPRFPSDLRLALYIQLTGGHGAYAFAVQLQDPEGEVVWDWELPQPVSCGDPLQPHELALYDVVVSFPRAGRYQLALLVEGEEVAHQSVWAVAAR